MYIIELIKSYAEGGYKHEIYGVYNTIDHAASVISELKTKLTGKQVKSPLYDILYELESDFHYGDRGYIGLYRIDNHSININKFFGIK